MENVNDAQGKVVRQTNEKVVFSANDLNINGTIDTQLKSRVVFMKLLFTIRS